MTISFIHNLITIESTSYSIKVSECSSFLTQNNRCCCLLQMYFALVLCATALLSASAVEHHKGGYKKVSKTWNSFKYTRGLLFFCLLQHPIPYQFSYGIKDDHYGPNFDRNEKSDGKTVQGSYSVQLPDGRKQIVRGCYDN